ncbi:Phosphoglycolate phosphatase, plasmid [Paraburkholderia ultramafica]|uniref:phosphoglycolate phosphatase n=1 Tax=Paraburkholderia ultramafica TaxID=1544867 RepID=A0A6S7D5N7_9BURK|nr:HAD-IA family hydrolase [Paraburkholderia ultramafica]CAB3807494.1 Phosphoglycolate phosphatase, plasmid [Paraburkholderia ultramafica]
MQIMTRILPVDAVLFDFEGSFLHKPPDIGDVFDRALSGLRPGVEAALDSLRQMGMKLGIVTDKEMRFVTPLLRQSGLSAWIDIIVHGDTLAQRKPDPAPLLHACDALAVEPAHALHVGDSLIDAMAAQAAGMAMIRVSHGRGADQPVPELPCLQVIDDLCDLPELIGGPSPWRRPKGALSAVQQPDEQGGRWI